MIVSVTITGCAPSRIDKENEEPSEDHIVTFKTTEGPFDVSLYPMNAPATCEQFLKWCEGIEVPGKGYSGSLYLGNDFYNVEPGRFIQTGDVFNQGRGHEAFEREYERTYVLSEAGSVFMVKNPKTNLNNSIFGILLEDNPNIGKNFTVFGKVTDGLDICYKISNVPSKFDENLGIKKPINAVKITEVNIINKR